MVGSECFIERVRADDGVELHVEVVGDRTAEHTIVLVNGLNTALIYWSRQRRTLADLGTIVLFDHRGHGLSGESTVENATIGQLGRDVMSVIEAVAPTGRVIVIAHSLGGMALCALADRQPELFGARISGVVLLDTVAGGWGEIGLRVPRWCARLITRVLWWLVPPVRRMFTDTSERRHARFGHAARPVNQTPSRHLRRVRHLITSLRTMTLLSLIADAALCDHASGLMPLGAAPTLVVAGDNDRFISLRHKIDTASAIPGARLAVVPDAGHLSSIRKPDEVDHLLREFIVRLQRGGER